jgi:hypothetical protein
MDLSKKHTLQAQALAGFLNTNGDAEKSQVVEILEILRLLNQTVQQMHFEQHSGVAFADVSRHPNVAAMRKRLNTALEKFLTHPRMGIPTKQQDGVVSLDVGWNSTRPVPYQLGPNGIVMDKSYALELLLQLANNGTLPNLKRCISVRCSKWFYSTNGQKLTCDVRCRRQHQASSPDFKKQRREYMKKYVPLKNSGKVK